MNSPDSGAASVELTIPMRAEFASIARLTASGVANRMGFDIEAIEDIKVSLSEVCNRIIGKLINHSPGKDVDCKIIFTLSDDNLGISFYIDGAESLRLFEPEFKQIDAGAAESPRLNTRGAEETAGIGVDLDKLFEDHPDDGHYNDQLQLALINLLMDEFIVNPSENCLVSMKKIKNVD